MTVELSSWLAKGRWQKRLLAVVAALCVCFAFSYLYDQHDTDLPEYGDNVWFQGDIGRVYGNMNNRYAFGHYRAKVHPLYSLQTYPPTFILKHIFSSDAKAIRYVTLAIVALWTYSLYLLLRLMGLLRTDAAIFTLLGLSSSAALFWLTVPETYALGSIGIMCALSLSAIAQRNKLSDGAYIAMSAYTFSVTITNWMAGLISTFTAHSFKRAVKISLITLLVVTALWGVQKLLFPTSGFFIGNSEEGRFIFAPTLERVSTVFHTFFFHSIITPAISTIQFNQFGWPMLSVQSSPIGSSNIYGAAASCLWGVLLGLGIWALLSKQYNKTFKLTLALTLLGQLALHLLYGEETFLYTLHFMPLLVVLAAFTTLTHFRKPVLIIALTLLPLMLTNNLNQFYHATATFKPYHHTQTGAALKPS